MSDLIHRSDVEKLLNQMISDANNDMYPEGKVLEMKEFNMFSCGKASLEILKDRLSSIRSVDVSRPIIVDNGYIADSAGKFFNFSNPTSHDK